MHPDFNRRVSFPQFFKALTTLVIMGSILLLVCAPLLGLLGGIAWRLILWGFNLVA